MPRIELDLDRMPPPSKPLPRELPTAQPWESHRPRIDDSEANRIGSDTARKTVGALYLVDAVFAALLIFSKGAQESGGLTLIALLVAFFAFVGVSLIRGSDFIEKIILLISYLRVGVNAILFLVNLGSPGIALLAHGAALITSVGLIFLLSGKSLSKPVYFIATAVVALSHLL